MRRILKCFQLPLILLAVFMLNIPTSRTLGLKDTQVAQESLNPTTGQIWRNVAELSHAITPSLSSILSRNNNKQFDERISNLIAENVLHFGHNLGLQLAAQDPYFANSEIFSPLSIMSALSLLMLGAKGKSYQELKQMIGLDFDSELANYPSKFHEEFGLMLNDIQHLSGNTRGLNKRQNAYWRDTNLNTGPMRVSSRPKPVVEHIIKVANGLFVQSGYTLNPDYIHIVKSIYDSELTQLNFQARSTEARDHINEWVKKSTYGKIPQIINGEIEKSTNVILASVLYFKGFWENSFFPRSTTEDNFYPDGLNGPSIKVQMMPTGGKFPFYDAKEYDCRIIGLPYKGNETTMYVIQPNNSSRQKLRDLQHVLTAQRINKMIDNMERKTTVMVFPKMHFTRSMTMKTLLQNLGIQDIFLNGYSDLSLIGGQRQSSTNVVSSSASATVSAAPNNFVAAPIPAAPNNFVAAPVGHPAPTAHFISTGSNFAHAPVPQQIITFDSIRRDKPTQQKTNYLDRYDEPALIFTSRFGEIEESGTNVTTTNITEIPSTEDRKPELNRNKRQVPIFQRDPTTEALAHLESERLKSDQYRSDLFVDDIIHKVDFAIDEQGTEAAAATLTYLHRSGTDVVFRGETPFLIVIRHDPTKLPLFYGVINKPEL